MQCKVGRAAPALRSLDLATAMGEGALGDGVSGARHPFEAPGLPGQWLKNGELGTRV
jgi:hypothetical protein